METVFQRIDQIIARVNLHKVEPLFSKEFNARSVRTVPNKLTKDLLFENFVYLMTYSQNAKAHLVEETIKSGIFSEIFAGFDLKKVITMNPCDLADTYWEKISGIRQQSKLFHIISLARKLDRLPNAEDLFLGTQIPHRIFTSEDMDLFWIGFRNLKSMMTEQKIPFFRSTTSLLHFLMHIGYDCIKPDSAVMKVSHRIGIADKTTGERNLIATVRTVQRYSIVREIRPSVIDLYLLIDGEQSGAKKYVTSQYYD